MKWIFIKHCVKCLSSRNLCELSLISSFRDQKRVDFHLLGKHVLSTSLFFTRFLMQKQSSSILCRKFLQRSKLRYQCCLKRNETSIASECFKIVFIDNSCNFLHFSIRFYTAEKIRQHTPQYALKQVLMNFKKAPVTFTTRKKKCS